MNQFDLQAEDGGDGVEMGELHVAAVFEVADGVRVGSAGPFRDSIPGESLRLAGLANLGGNSARPGLPPWRCGAVGTPVGPSCVSLPAVLPPRRPALGGGDV